MAKLVINPTSATKKEIPIVSRVISIGRDPSNDLVLSDSMVSRRHAILEQRDNHYILRDNNSSNGTMVNGDRVDSEKQLRDGDLVAIGSSRLLFQLDDTAEASLPALAAVSGRSHLPPSIHKPSPEISKPAARPHGAHEETRCTACGKTVLPTDRFCRGCGRELASEKKSVLCASCGTEVQLPAEFCPHCGKPLTGREKPPILSTRSHRRSDLESELLRGGSDELPQKARARAPVVAAAKSPDKLDKHEKPDKNEEPAGFGIRLLAFLVDEMILGIPLLLGGLAWMTVFVTESSSAAAGHEDSSSPLVNFAFLLYFVFCSLYYVLFWGGRGATPGKSLLGLTVRTESGETPIGYGRALLRLAGYMVSSSLLGLGFIWILFSEDRLGLHDRIAGTRVTRSS